MSEFLRLMSVLRWLMSGIPLFMSGYFMDRSRNRKLKSVLPIKSNICSVL